MPANPLQHLDPSPDHLFQLVFQYVDDSMLLEIAEADYGCDANNHLKVLMEIKAGDFPDPMAWEPQEVLELIRWSEPEDPTWKPGATGERGHWMRLFSCTLLVHAAVKQEHSGYFLGEESTIIQLVDSAIKLGPESSHAALRFLAWRMKYQTPDDWTSPYFAIAILLLAVSLGECSDEMEDFLIATAQKSELTLTQLLGECQKWQTWHQTIRNLLINSSTTSDELKLFGYELIGD